MEGLVDGGSGALPVWDIAMAIYIFYVLKPLPWPPPPQGPDAARQPPPLLPGWARQRLPGLAPADTLVMEAQAT